MPSTEIKLGILSLSSFAQRTIIPTLLTSKLPLRLYAIASREVGKATEAATKYNCIAYSNYDELIIDKSIDAVYMPLPNSLHYIYIKKALLNGKHVLCEKSLGLNAQEVNELCDLAEKENLVLMENFQFRFHPQLQAIKDIIKSGEIGSLRCVRSSFGFPPFDDENNIRYKKELGGGALLDAGAYPVKVTQEFLGRDLVVMAANLNVEQPFDVDIWGGAYIKQKNGPVFSEIAFGFDHFYQCSIEFWGSKGKLFTNRIFTAHPNFQPEAILETNDGEKIIPLPRANHFELMLLHFVELITNPSKRNDEYFQNKVQAQLLEQIKLKSTE
jgi:predicted dehydrogenase